MINQSQRLSLTATTGSAAARINGYILHSAVGIPVDVTDSVNAAFSNNPSDKDVSKWQEIDYLIINEVSMMDCKAMMLLNKKLNLVRGAKDSQASRSFRGEERVNISFIGDFYQLPAV